MTDFMKGILVSIAAAAFVGFAWLALPGPDQARTPGVSQPTAIGRGLVVGVDRDKGILTISHEPLRELNMMAMTMGFPVRNRNLLLNLQPMQKIEFRLVFDGNSYVITDIK